MTFASTAAVSNATVAVGMDIGSCNARIATYDTNLQHPVVAANHDGHRETKVLWSADAAGGLGAADGGSGNGTDDPSSLSSSQPPPPPPPTAAMEEQPVTTAEQLKGFVQAKLLTLAASSAHTKDLSILVSISNDDDSTSTNSSTTTTSTVNRQQQQEWLQTLQSMNCAVLTEAAAILLAYRVNAKDYRRVLVLDGGASALKATILSHAGDGLWRQVHFARLTTVHGPALVEPLARAVAQQFEQQRRVPRGEVWQSRRARGKLQQACEQVLSHFQRLQTVSIHVDGLYEGMDCNVSISKPKWEHLSSSLANQVKSFCQQEVSGHDVETVLIAGNLHDWILPIVKATLGSDKLHPNTGTLDPSEAIALGCTYQSYWNLQHELSMRDNDKENSSNNNNNSAAFLSKDPAMSVVCSPVEIGIQQLQQGGDDDDDDEDASSSSTLRVLIAKGTPLPCQVEYEIDHSSLTSSSSLQLIQTLPNRKALIQLDDLTTTTEPATTHIQLQLSVEGRLRIQINKEESIILG